MMDNAKYHTSEETRDALRKMQLPILFTGPYSYSSCPIEYLFAGLKNTQLLSVAQPSGKKYVLLLLIHIV